MSYIVIVMSFQTISSINYGQIEIQGNYYVVTCNYRIKETKPFAFIYFSTNLTWQTAVRPVPFTIQNTDQQYSQTSSQKLKTFCPRTSPSSVSFKKVNYAQH